MKLKKENGKTILVFENMPSHPCDFSRELDGYRFLNT